jgi:predicted polyphosphate/ATP-dependent NAD kinase
VIHRTLGLIVNPIAGMGGRVGLKGTDGPQTVAQARALGAVPLSAVRAAQALGVIAQANIPGLEVLTAPGSMGEEIVRELGWQPRVIGEPLAGETTAADTERAAATMAALGVDLLLFAGGDGTARNICHAIGTSIPAIGIPTGVKMHSAVYATSPRAAGEIVVRSLTTESAATREAEVMDIDEEAFRQGIVSARLYGALRVPVARGLLQGLKSGRGGGEPAELAAIAADVVRRMLQAQDRVSIIGPGGTTRAILDQMGLPSTLLGVDVLYRGEVLRLDATERELLGYLAQTPGQVIVTPIGGQGFLFGRGNQQISAEVLRRVGLENIVVVATPSKLSSLAGGPLRVDTGDEELDALLRGYRRVVTGYGMETVYPVG